MKVMLFGGTGFIGGHLQKALRQKGHEVLTRDVRRDLGFSSEIGTCDAVINLGGAGLFAKRWSMKYKETIIDSRVESTRRIVDAIGDARGQHAKPLVLINASAIGWYGASNYESFDESQVEPGTDFLAFVCREWEAEAEKAHLRHNVRTVIARFGIVLGPDGGALAQLIPPFKAFVGGPIGDGKQWMSWVHVDDVCGLIIHALENNQVEGVLNVVAPNPVQNREFSKTLGDALGRPSFIPVPKLGLYALVGEAASTVTASQRILPTRTLATGYRFKFDRLKPALEAVVAAQKNSKPTAA